MPSTGVRVTEAESLSRDLVKVSEWCDLLWIKLNVSKTKTLIVYRSCTQNASPVYIGGTVLMESDNLVILGMAFDSNKTNFEKQLRSFSRAASETCGILRKYWQVFHDRFCILGDAFGVLSCPFWSTVLHCAAKLPIHTLNYWTV